MSKGKYKKYVHYRVNKVALESLMSCDKSKVQSIIKSTKVAKDGKSKIQEYLRTTKLTTLEKHNIFELRYKTSLVRAILKPCTLII